MIPITKEELNTYIENVAPVLKPEKNLKIGNHYSRGNPSDYADIYIGSQQNLSEIETTLRERYNDNESPAEALLEYHNDISDKKIKIIPVTQYDSDLVNKWNAVTDYLDEYSRQRWAQADGVIGAVSQVPFSAATTINGFFNMFPRGASWLGKELGNITEYYGLKDIDRDSAISLAKVLSSDSESMAVISSAIDKLDQAEKDGINPDVAAYEAFAEGTIDLTSSLATGMYELAKQDPITFALSIWGIDEAIGKSLLVGKTTPIKKLFGAGKSVAPFKMASKEGMGFANRVYDAYTRTASEQATLGIANANEVTDFFGKVWDAVERGTPINDVVKAVDKVASGNNGITEPIKQIFKHELIKKAASKGDSIAKVLIDKAHEFAYSPYADGMSAKTIREFGNLDTSSEVARTAVRPSRYDDLIADDAIRMSADFTALTALNRNVDKMKLPGLLSESFESFASAIPVPNGMQTELQDIVKGYSDTILKAETQEGAKQAYMSAVQEMTAFAQTRNMIAQKDVDGILESLLGPDGTNRIYKYAEEKSIAFDAKRGSKVKRIPKAEKSFKRMINDTSTPESLSRSVVIENYEKKLLERELSEIKKYSNVKSSKAIKELKETIKKSMGDDLKEAASEVRALDELTATFMKEVSGSSINDIPEHLRTEFNRVNTKHLKNMAEIKKKALLDNEPDIYEAFIGIEPIERTAMDVERDLVDVASRTGKKMELADKAAREIHQAWSVNMRVGDAGVREPIQSLIPAVYKQFQNVVGDIEKNRGIPVIAPFNEFSAGERIVGNRVNNTVLLSKMNELDDLLGATKPQRKVNLEKVRSLNKLYRVVDQELFDDSINIMINHLSGNVEATPEQLRIIAEEFPVIYTSGKEPLQIVQKMRQMSDEFFDEFLMDPKECVNCVDVLNGAEPIYEAIPGARKGSYSSSYVFGQGTEREIDEIVTFASKKKLANVGREHRELLGGQIDTVSADPINSMKAAFSNAYKERYVGKGARELDEIADSLVGTPTGSILRNFMDSAKGNDVEGSLDFIMKPWAETMIKHSLKAFGRELSESDIAYIVKRMPSEFSGAFMRGAIAWSIPSMMKQMVQKGFPVSQVGLAPFLKAIPESFSDDLLREAVDAGVINLSGDLTSNLLTGVDKERSFVGAINKFKKKWNKGVSPAQEKVGFLTGRVADIKNKADAFGDLGLYLYQTWGDVHNRLVAYASGKNLADDVIVRALSGNLVERQGMNVVNRAKDALGFGGMKPVYRKTIQPLIEDVFGNIQKGVDPSEQSVVALRKAYGKYVADVTNFVYGNTNRSMSGRSWTGKMTELFSTWPKGLANMYSSMFTSVLEEYDNLVKEGFAPLDAAVRNNYAFHRMGTLIAGKGGLAFGASAALGASIMPWLFFGPIASTSVTEDSPINKAAKGFVRVGGGIAGLDSRQFGKGVSDLIQTVPMATLPGFNQARRTYRGLSKRGENDQTKTWGESLRTMSGLYPTNTQKGKDAAKRAYLPANIDKTMPAMKPISQNTADAKIVNLKKQAEDHLNSGVSPKYSSEYQRAKEHETANQLRKKYKENGITEDWIDGPVSKKLNSIRQQILNRRLNTVPVIPGKL